MEELIAKERVRFREKNGISEAATVFFLAPGTKFFWLVILRERRDFRFLIFCLCC